MKFNFYNIHQSIENTSVTIVVFVLLFLNNVTFIPDGNEETYLQFSKQFINPNWIPNSFTITEFPGSRLAYEYICGWALQFVSFEFLVFFIRTCCCLFYSLAISNIVKELKISNYTVIIVLQISIWIPSYFSGENIFVGAEPKHFAYIFILFALQYLLQNRFIKMLMFVMAASVFHILVGGWFFAAVCIYLILFKQKPLYIVIGYGILYLIILSPLIYYLMHGIHFESNAIMNGINADEIYSFFRTPHHTGIFKSLDYFYHEHLNGILAFVFSLGLVGVLHKNISLDKLALSRFLISIGILLIINLIIAAFDKHGHFVKYYPFRMTALFSFLFYMYVISYLFKNEILDSLKMWVLALAITFGTIHLTLVVYKSIIKKEAYTDFIAATSFIKNNTPKNAVFFYHTMNDDYTLQFTRLTERERYVVFKFAPAGTNKIFEWFRRMNVADKILIQPEWIFNEQKNVPIDFYLSENEINNPNFNLVYSNKHYNLYHLSK